MADITNSGFIKLHRKMLEWEWYTDTNVKVVFIHCLLKANFTQKNWRGITIERGSFITSYANLARELNLSVKQVRLAIEKLKRTGELATKTTNKYSIITIKNYDEYQSQDIQEDKQEDTQRANRGQTKGKQRATTKNDKNDKNDKKYIDIDIVESDHIPYKEIVDYLNQRCGTSYRHTTRKTRDLIRARWKEGFKLDDFYMVIDKKAAEWQNDPKMSKYLRPETLFGPKFEGYLNQPVRRTLADINLTPNMDLFD